MFYIVHQCRWIFIDYLQKKSNRYRLKITWWEQKMILLRNIYASPSFQGLMNERSTIQLTRITRPILALLTLYNTFKPRAATIPIPSAKGAYPPTISGPEAELVVVSVKFPSGVLLLLFDLARAKIATSCGPASLRACTTGWDEMSEVGAKGWAAMPKAKEHSIKTRTFGECIAWYWMRWSPRWKVVFYYLLCERLLGNE